MLQFNFKISQIAGLLNTAADFLSRQEMKLTEKIRLEIREDVQTTPIEVTTSSSDVADEKQLFFTQTYGKNETEKQTLKRQEEFRKKATEWETHEKTSSMKSSVKEVTKMEGNTTSYSMNGIKANARIRVEQNVDLVLKNKKLNTTQPLDEVLLTTGRRFKHYKANENCNLHKESLFILIYYGETDNVIFYQILILKGKVDELPRSLHGEFWKHPEWAKQ